MAYWESEQFIVLLNQGNAYGGKELTVEPLRPGHNFDAGKGWEQNCTQ